MASARFLVQTLLVVLCLVVRFAEAYPCIGCDQLGCRSNCITDLEYCYDYERRTQTKQHCLSFYYVCGAACAFLPL